MKIVVRRSALLAQLRQVEGALAKAQSLADLKQVRHDAETLPL
jgi:hypothetical protein